MKPLETLLRAFVDLHPDDAARAFESLPFQGTVRLMKNLPAAEAVTLLERIAPHLAAPILEKVDTARVCELLCSMSPRTASTVLHHLPEPMREDILREVDEQLSAQLRALANYEEHSAGAIMEPRVASFRLDLTAQEAITKIRKTPRDVLHYLYVTQRDGTLIGVMNMRDLLLASPRDTIESLVNRNVVSVPDTMDREEVARMMSERGYVALPVVNFEGRLVGVVRHDQVLKTVQDEAFEDMQRLVGAGAEERALSPIRTVVKSRLPWLLVNLGTAFLAAAVVGMFEGVIAKVAALAVLLPVVAGQGGNTGSQSLAVVMRGLALREIIPGVKRRVLMKETVAALINGVVIATVTAAAVFAWRRLAGDTMQLCGGLALVIGLAMIVNMAIAALAGTAIPLILKAVGRDPAQSSAIFLTTVTDIVGFGSFLGFAVVLLTLLG